MNVLLRSQEVLDSCDEFYIGDILFKNVLALPGRQSWMAVNLGPLFVLLYMFRAAIR